MGHGTQEGTSPVLLLLVGKYIIFWLRPLDFTRGKFKSKNVGIFLDTSFLNKPMKNISNFCKANKISDRSLQSIMPPLQVKGSGASKASGMQEPSKGKQKRPNFCNFKFLNSIFKLHVIENFINVTCLTG